MSLRPKVLAFGPYILDLKAAELRAGRRKIDLPPKQFGTLEQLVRAAGQTVSKEHFHASVWKNSHVEEGNLTQAIFQLRRILGRQPNGREYIETVPRKGYRLDSQAITSHAQDAPDKGFEVATVDEQHYRLLVDSIEDYAIYMLDCGGRVCTWNLGAERNKGYTASEVIGQHYSMFFVPDDIESRLPEKQLKAAIHTGHHVGEGWRLRKNGERFWASFVLTAMRDPQRKLIGFAKVVRDFSFRKRQEEDLLRMEAMVRRERDRLSAAAESSMDAFYICQAVRNQAGDIEDFVFTFLNSNVEKMVSIPRATLLNGKVCELLPVNRSTGLFDAYKKVVDTGEPFIAELPVHAENVLSEWIRVQAVKLEDGVAITASDITQRKRSEEQVFHLAHHDPLTGLINRSLLEDRVTQAIERVRRYGGYVAVCMIDLDNFKPINDRYGHQIGDQVLVETSRRIRAAVRATDSVIRLGGDEFVVVLPQDSVQTDAKKVAAKIESAISLPIILDGLTLKIGCSLGLAVYPRDATDFQALLVFADQAMYRVKGTARDRLPRERALSQR